MKKAAIWKNLIICLVIVIVLAVFMDPQSPVSMEALDKELLIKGNSGYTIRIIYAEIQHSELRESLDYGVIVSGENERREKSGTWRNEEFGEYRICVDAKVDYCIVLYTESEIQVVNIESNESTASLYEAILKLADDTE